MRSPERARAVMSASTAAEGSSSSTPILSASLERLRWMSSRRSRIWASESPSGMGKSLRPAPVDHARAAWTLGALLARLLQQAGGADVAAEVGGVDRLAAQGL